MKITMRAVVLILAAVVMLLIFGRKEIHTDIVIDAPVEAVWRDFGDFSSYPEWNPFILRLTGEAAEGKRISVSIKPSGGKPMDFDPVILSKRENRLLSWEGRLLAPGIFTGTHTFRVEPLAGDKTRFIQEESFTGILVPFVDLGPSEEGFKLMNAELKKRVEGKKEKRPVRLLP